VFWALRDLGVSEVRYRAPYSCPPRNIRIFSCQSHAGLAYKKTSRARLDATVRVSLGYCC
jgi:hypothetical protein